MRREKEKKNIKFNINFDDSRIRKQLFIFQSGCNSYKIVESEEKKIKSEKKTIVYHIHISYCLSFRV